MKTKTKLLWAIALVMAIFAVVLMASQVEGFLDWRIRDNTPGAPAASIRRTWTDAASIYGHCMNSDGTPCYRDPLATTSSPGLVIPDGTSITITPSGVISAEGGIGGGGMTLLEEQNAGSSAALTSTTAITSGYDDYLIELVSLVASTNAVILQMQVSTNGGSTWQNSGYHFMYWVVNDAAGSGVNSSSGTTVVQICDQVSSTAGRSVNATIRLFDPLNGASIKNGLMQSVWFSSDGKMRSQAGSFIWPTTTAVNALKFFFSSGSITSGTMRVYGLTH